MVQFATSGSAIKPDRYLCHTILRRFIHLIIIQPAEFRKVVVDNFHLHTRFPYTGCPKRNGQNFGRVFLMLNYTDIIQNTYIQS